MRKKKLQNLNIQTIPIVEIKRAAYNPRRAMTEKEQKSFDAELDKFSCIEPLIWNKHTGNLVGGHKRLDWLEKRGAIEVQVNVVDLSEQEEKLLNVALNKQGEGLWDTAKLELLVEELKTENIDVLITGLPDPKAPEYEIKPEDMIEDNPKLKNFIAQRKKSRKQGYDAGELNFWLCLVFQSWEQKQEFLKQFPELETKYGMYVDGEIFADAVGKPVTKSTRKVIQVRLDKKLVDRVIP